MTCKVDNAAWVAGDRIGALRIAARFFDRSSTTKTFKHGVAAHNHPGFYRQLGQVPDSRRASSVAGPLQFVDRMPLSICFDHVGGIVDPSARSMRMYDPQRHVIR